MIQNSKAAKKVILILILVVIIGLAVQSIILMVINHYAPVESIRSEEDIAEIMEVRVFCLNLKYLINNLCLYVFQIGILLLMICLIKYKFTFSFHEISLAFIALLAGAAIVTVPFAMFNNLYASEYLKPLYITVIKAAVICTMMSAINFALWIRKRRKS